MKFDPHSLFFKTTTAFAMFFLLLTFTFALIAKNEYVRQIEDKGKHVFPFMASTFQHFMQNHDVTTFKTRMESFGFILVREQEHIESIRENGKIIRHRLPERLKRHFAKRGFHGYDRQSQQAHFGLIRHDGSIYLTFHSPLLRDTLYKIDQEPDLTHLLAGYTLSLILLGLLYYSLIKSLRPIRKLQAEIEKFSEGHLDIDTKSTRKDEIAKVSNAFQRAVDRLKTLTESRQLFIRNIMHELKTPIHKGRLALEMIPDSKYRERLQKVFDRQEEMIDEYRKIETLTAKGITLQRKPYRLVDLLEDAAERTSMDQQGITLHIGDIHIEADYELLVTALKNLLDNALKYSPDHVAHVFSEQNTLMIVNQGKPLDQDLHAFTEPYSTTGAKQQESRGLGLGLYITLRILDLHGYKLTYAHKDGKNTMALRF